MEFGLYQHHWNMFDPVLHGDWRQKTYLVCHRCVVSIRRKTRNAKKTPLLLANRA